MKKTIKGYILGFLTAVILVGGMTYAAQTVKIVINGTELIPTDATGKRVDPLLVDGTTYLPVRAIASALGLNVGWDEDTYTVSLDKPVEEIKEEPAEEVKEEMPEKAPEPEVNENIFEGIAQVTVNNIDKETSKLWDREKNKTYTVQGVYMLGEWGHYRIVDGKLESFDVIDHYGWTRAKVKKTGWGNLQGINPRFQIMLEDGTVLTIADRNVRINDNRYDMRTENASEGLYGMVQSAIGTGEIWYQTDDNGYITKIDKIN